MGGGGRGFHAYMFFFFGRTKGAIRVLSLAPHHPPSFLLLLLLLPSLSRFVHRREVGGQQLWGERHRCMDIGARIQLPSGARVGISVSVACGLLLSSFHQLWSRLFLLWETRMMYEISARFPHLTLATNNPTHHGSAPAPTASIRLHGPSSPQLLSLSQRKTPKNIANFQIPGSAFSVRWCRSERKSTPLPSGEW